MQVERILADETRPPGGERPAGDPLALPCAGAAATLVPDNRDAFALRALSARAARRTLDLQYYNWHEDCTGLLLAREVLRAADRGVRVRLLLDDLYVRERARSLAALAAHPSAEVRLFNPFGIRRLGVPGQAADLLLSGWRLNHRMHNKCWIVDGRLAVLGGRNLGDEYFDAASQFNFRDLDVALQGEAAAQAATAFERYWTSPRVRPVEAVVAARPPPDGLERLRARLEEAAASPGARAYFDADHDEARELSPILAEGRVALEPGEVALVSDPPGKRLGARRREPGVLEAVRRAVASAERELTLVSPYFVPGRRASRLIAGLARRGVRVRVVTNSLDATDVLAVHGGYARYRRRLLRAGVEIHELKRGGQEGASLLGSGGGASLHTKALVADGRVGFVGSFNLDPRSARLNTEMGVFVRHEAFARQLEEEVARLTDPARSWRLGLEDGRLVWTDLDEAGAERRATGEPGAPLGRRVLARLLGWLPIEAHL